MVPHDVSDKTPVEAPLRPTGHGGMLVARLHVDLCRLASAICPC
ncbi:putative leader peptide [Streptomyces sulfonofaciens]|nr:putative leader peptide [Streptomyces sulfonofaciens]